MWAGLIPGFLFGFLLKRSRMCLAGGLRDVYMEKRRSGLISMLLIIFTQSVVYFSLIRAGVLAMPEPKAFPFAATVIGGLLFGLGALIANGCITTTLVKVGDGRLAGFMSLFSFMIVGVASQKGFLSPLVAKLRAVGKVQDGLLAALPVAPLWVAVLGLALVLGWAFYDRKTAKPPFVLPAQYHGARHLFFEKIWSVYAAAVLIGVFAGLSYAFSKTMTGTPSAWGITGGVTGWLRAMTEGGAVKWAQFFVLGIVLGSFVCTYGSGEFSFKGTDGATLLRAMAGGALMAFGSVLGGGCIVGHGLSGTARLSLTSWVAFASITLGIWAGVRLFYKDAIVTKK